MLDRITRAGIASRLAIAGFVGDRFERAKSDRGQGSVEYVGIIVVVVAIMVAMAGLGLTGIGETIISKIQEAINEL